jgi:hypothetical protein
MKTAYWGIALVITMGALTGCKFLGGAATGVAGTGAGYEYNARMQMERLEDDYKAGKIDKEEYEIRKDQIERGSVVY